MNTTLLIINIIKYVILFYLTYQAFMLAYVAINKSNQLSEITQNAVDAAIGRSDSLYFSRENLTAIMSKYGLMSMLGDYNIEPSTFIMIKSGFGIGAAIFGAMIAPNAITKVLAVVILAVAGFFAPDALLKIQNKSDNDDMNEDIIMIYGMLKTNAKSAVYIVDSLIECQRSVSDKRLKEALNEMNNNILSSRVTPEEAVDIFNSRFDNQHIDNLAIIIKQALKTGRATTILDDISKQIQIMNSSKAAMEKDKTKRRTAMIQVVFFMVISAIAIYLIGTQMLLSLKSI